MSQWEYTASVVNKDGPRSVLQELNLFGAEGWQAVGFEWFDSDDEKEAVIYFKRLIIKN